MLIDCDTCQVRNLACDDCVVTVLLGPVVAGSAGIDPVELDGQDRAAIAVLASSGLVPPLRLVPESPAGARVRETSKDSDGTVKRRATG